MLLAMTRYAIMAGDRWITAVYPDQTLQVTTRKEDASSWSTHDRAAAVARVVAECTSKIVVIHAVEEPSYRGMK